MRGWRGARLYTVARVGVAGVRNTWSDPGRANSVGNWQRNTFPHEIGWQLREAGGQLAPAADVAPPPDVTPNLSVSP